MENKILATIGNKNITEADIEEVLKAMHPQQAMQFRGEAGKKQIIAELISQELLYLDGVDNNLEDEKEFQEQLAMVKESYLKQYAMKKLLNAVDVSVDEIKEYYETNKENFKEDEKAQASHILVDTEEEANDILNKINEGMSFADAAKEFSKCPSNMAGGDLGTFGRGQMVPEFESAVFTMSIGEISSPIKTQFGYHLINLVDKIESGLKTFEQVEKDIFNQLLRDKQRKVYDAKVELLKLKYPVSII